MEKIPSPKTNEEKFLYSILTEDIANLPFPRSNQEVYLEAIARKVGNNGNGNGGSTSKYEPKVYDILPTDWVAEQESFTYSITHNLNSANIIWSAWEKEGNIWATAILNGEQLDSNTLKIKSDKKIESKVVIVDFNIKELKQQNDLAKDNINILSEQVRQATEIVNKNEEIISKGNFATQGDIAQVNSQLEHIAINVDLYGLKGDGINDDSLLLQNLFNDIKNNEKVKKIVFAPGKRYLLKNKINIYRGDIEIDFNGATIIWYNTENIVNNFPTKRDFWTGAFYFQGEETATITNVIEYRTNISRIDNTTNSVPSKTGVWTTTDATQFQKDDYIYISCPFTTPTSYDNAKPMAMMLARIIKIEGNDIYTDYYSPFDWSQYIFDENCKITKIVTVDNIKIKNMNYIDNNPEIALDFIKDTDSNMKRQVSAIGLKYCSNVVLENIKTEGTHFSGIEPYACHTITGKNIKVSNPKYNGDGNGYAIHVNRSMNVHLSEIEGINCRHTVDFSGSAFGSIRNSKGSGVSQFDFDLHGMCEHDITIDTCVGNIKLGHGVTVFPDIMANVTINNCDIAWFNFNWLKNLVINNSRFIFTGGAGGEDHWEAKMYEATFNDCDIEILNWTKFSGYKRGLDISTKLTFNNCKINGFETSDTLERNVIKFHNIDNLIFNNCKTDIYNLNSRFYISRIKRLCIENSDFINTYFQFSGGQVDSLLDINYLVQDSYFYIDDNCKYITENVDSHPFSPFNQLSYCKGVIKLENNKFRFASNNRVLSVLYMPSTWQNTLIGSTLKIINNNTSYISNGTKNVKIGSNMYTDIDYNVTGQKFIEENTGIFEFEGFNIKDSDIKYGLPLIRSSIPTQNPVDVKIGHIIYKDTLDGDGNITGWYWTGAEWRTINVSLPITTTNITQSDVGTIDSSVGEANYIKTQGDSAILRLSILNLTISSSGTKLTTLSKGVPKEITPVIGSATASNGIPIAIPIVILTTGEVRAYNTIEGTLNLNRIRVNATYNTK